MACCSCGLRQRSRTGYCEQCGCPLGALAPPPPLERAGRRAQRAPVLDRHPVTAGASLVQAALCLSLAWLPYVTGPALCLGAALLSTRALCQAGTNGPLRLMARLVLILAGACTIPALSGL